MGNEATGIIVFVLICVALVVIRWAVTKGTVTGMNAVRKGIDKYAGKYEESTPKNLSDRFKK